MIPGSLRIAGLVASLALGACSSFEPSGDTPFEPPAIYKEWWGKTEACAGLQGDFGSLRWYRVDGHSFACPDGACVGWWASSGRIYLAGDWTRDEMVVRHEMLHALIRSGRHPNPPFGTPCQLTWDTWQGGHSS